MQRIIYVLVKFREMEGRGEEAERGRENKVQMLKTRKKNEKMRVCVYMYV